MDPTIYPHIVRAVLDRPWAIRQATLEAIVEVVSRRASGVTITREDIRERLALAAERQGPRAGGRRTQSVAVIPVYGVISPRASMFSEASGGTSLEALRAMFRDAVSDGDVGAIVLDMDTPGGNVEGIPELAAEIRAARATKPILASANYAALSAGYWLASQADVVTVSPSGQVGSIGVVAAHVDQSEAERMEGLKTTILTSSGAPYKAEGNTHEPLADEARGVIQTDLDAFEAMFHKAVARGMGVPIDTVRESFGKGRVHLADEALSRGMVHHVETLEETIVRAGRMATEQARRTSARAMGAASLEDAPEVGDTMPPDADPPVVPVPGPPVSARLALVSDELDAAATHLREHLAMRAREGRSLSQATRAQVERLLANRAVLDEIEALVRDDAPGATAPDPAPRRVRRDLELLEAANAGGYHLST